MKKYIKQIHPGILTITLLVGIFAFPHLSYAGICDAPPTPEIMLACGAGKIASAAGYSPGAAAGNVLASGIGWVISIVLLPLLSLLVYMGGIILNYAVEFSVVKMSANLTAGTIGEAWRTIRDVANMGFIFVLLYSSIMTIFGQSKLKETIVKIIIAALLINFSLFFTSVIIDTSNLLALTFYHAIAPGALDPGHSIHAAGISNAFMDQLGVQSVYKAVGLLGGGKLIVAGIVGAIALLIVAYVFFVVAIMFIIRFVVLAFVLILSPIMFLADIFPGLGGFNRQWWGALWGQAFFAPVYFLLTWIVLKVSQGLFSTSKDFMGAISAATSGAVPDPSTAGVLLNYVVFISFLLASLFIAKSIASKAGGGVQRLTGAATGAFFGGVLGGAGRNTVGRLGRYFEGNKNLVNAANKEVGTKGAAARLALYASRKASGGTFDLRNATVPTGAISDLVRGTAGRTEAGRTLGLDEYDNISSIPISPIIGDKGGTKGFRETSAESKKKWDEAGKKENEGARLAAAAIDVANGTKAGAKPAEMDKMEAALSKLTDKEVETMVEGNKSLLDSQEFANRISVQQLEALIKTEKLNEGEKDKLKAQRFKKIDNAMAAGTPSAAGKEIKTLTSKELEMINPDYLRNSDFVAELRPGQIDDIAKSNKFTQGQKNALRDQRKAPLITALNTTAPGYAPNPISVKNIISKMGGKDLAALMSTNITWVDPSGATVSGSILTHPQVLPLFKPNTLKKMAVEMNDSDIQTLRTALLTNLPATHPTVIWLNNPSTGGSDFA